MQKIEAQSAELLADNIATTKQPAPQAYRASILHFTADPAVDSDAYRWHADGLLLIADGRIQAAGDYARLYPGLPAETLVTDYRGKLIVPGFIEE